MRITVQDQERIVNMPAVSATMLEWAIGYLVSRHKYNVAVNGDRYMLHRWNDEGEWWFSPYELVQFAVQKANFRGPQ